MKGDVPILSTFRGWVAIGVPPIGNRRWPCWGEFQCVVPFRHLQPPKCKPHIFASSSCIPLSFLIFRHHVHPYSCCKYNFNARPVAQLTRRRRPTFSDPLLIHLPPTPFRAVSSDRPFSPREDLLPRPSRTMLSLSVVDQVATSPLSKLPSSASRYVLTTLGNLDLGDGR